MSDLTQEQFNILTEMRRRGRLDPERAAVVDEISRRRGVSEPPAQSRESVIREAGEREGRTFGPARAALVQAGEGVFGLGSRVGALKDYMGQEGNQFSYDEALEFRRAMARGAATENPAAGLGGYLAGAIAGGGGAGGLAVRAGARIAPHAVAAMLPRAGQTGRNIARVATAGAAGGAAQAAGEGELADASGGAVIGAVAAPALRGAALAASRALDRVARPTKAAIRLIAKGLRRQDETVEQAFGRIGSTIDEFRQVHGRNPAVNEIAESTTPSPIRSAVESSAVASRVAQENAERTLGGVPAELADRGSGLLRGRISPSPERVQAIAEREFDRFITQRGDTVIPSSEDFVELAMTPAFARAVYRNATDDVANAVRNMIQNGTPMRLRDLDNARKRLGRSLGPMQPFDRNFAALREAREAVTARISETVPEYGAALRQWGYRMDIQKGILAGRKVTSKSDPASFRDTYQSADRATQLGMRFGARSAIRTAVGESPGGAVSDVRKLAEDTGLHRRLSALLPEDEVSQVVQAANAAYTGLTARAANTPRTVRLRNNTAEMMRDMLESGVVLSGRYSGGFLVHVINRIAERAQISERSARRIAEMAYDPERLDDVLYELASQGLDPSNFRHAMSRAVMSGQLTGSLAAGGEQ